MKEKRNKKGSEVREGGKEGRKKDRRKERKKEGKESHTLIV